MGECLLSITQVKQLAGLQWVASCEEQPDLAATIARMKRALLTERQVIICPTDAPINLFDPYYRRYPGLAMILWCGYRRDRRGLPIYRVRAHAAA